MTRLLRLVVLVIALVSTLAMARSERIHVTAEVKQTTFIGDPDNPTVGDQRITRVVLVADRGEAGLVITPTAAIDSTFDLDLPPSPCSAEAAGLHMFTSRRSGHGTHAFTAE